MPYSSARRKARQTPPGCGSSQKIPPPTTMTDAIGPDAVKALFEEQHGYASPPAALPPSPAASHSPTCSPAVHMWALGARPSDGRGSRSGGEGYLDVGRHRMSRAASRFAVHTACGCVFRAGTLASPSLVERRS